MTYYYCFIGDIDKTVGTPNPKNKEKKTFEGKLLAFTNEKERTTFFNEYHDNVLNYKAYRCNKSTAKSYFAGATPEEYEKILEEANKNAI